MQNISEQKWSHKGLTSFFLLRFWIKISAVMTRNLLKLNQFDFFKKRFLSGMLIISRTLQKTIETSHFHWELSGKFRQCLLILENQQKVKKFLFSGSSKVNRQFWNFKRWNSHKWGTISWNTLINNWSEIQGISLFWRENASTSKDAIWLVLMALNIRIDEFKMSLLKWNQFQMFWKTSFSFLLSKKFNSFSLICFRKLVFVDAKVNFFQKSRNFWARNFYFRWLYIIEEMSKFDGWPVVGKLKIWSF